MDVRLLLATVLMLTCSVPAESGVSSIFHTLVGKFTHLLGMEICQEPWLQEDFKSLKQFFDTEFYGQHLVRDIVLGTLRGHIRNSNPQKALVLSLHGLTGNGRNYLSKAIARTLYAMGMDSKYVHNIVVTHTFPHQHKVDKYADQLRRRVVEAVSKCPRNLFIIDEMDRMPPGLIDSIKPYLDTYEGLGGVDYRKNIFLFLGNTGGRQINEYMLENRHRKRESIQIKEIEPILHSTAYNEGGLWRTRMIDNALISSFVPFLPMERKHVELCIRDDLKRKGIRANNELVKRVADELDYFPEDKPIYCTTGCKRVSQKVDMVLEHDEL